MMNEAKGGRYFDIFFVEHFLKTEKHCLMSDLNYHRRRPASGISGRGTSSTFLGASSEASAYGRHKAPWHQLNFLRSIIRGVGLRPA